MKSILTASICSVALAVAVPAMAQSGMSKHHHGMKGSHMTGPHTKRKPAGDPTTDQLNAQSLNNARGGSTPASGSMAPGSSGSMAPGSSGNMAPGSSGNMAPGSSNGMAPAGGGMAPSGNMAPGTGSMAPSNGAMAPAGSGTPASATPTNAPGGS